MKYFFCNFVLIIMFISFKTFAQEPKIDKFYFKSLATGFGICVGEKNSGGFDLYIDATTTYKDHLFSAAFSEGSEFALFDAYRIYKDFDLLYGREIRIFKFFNIETHAGIAIFKEIYKNGRTNFNEVSEVALGFPIKIKLLFYVSPHFALGLNPNATINSIDTIIYGNLIFQYKFNK